MTIVRKWLYHSADDLLHIGLDKLAVSLLLLVLQTGQFSLTKNCLVSYLLCLAPYSISHSYQQ